MASFEMLKGKEERGECGNQTNLSLHTKESPQRTKLNNFKKEIKKEEKDPPKKSINKFLENPSKVFFFPGKGVGG